MTERRLPLRCPSNHWGFAVDATGTHEVRCRARHCRTAEGHAVIHVFDNATGSYVTTVAPQELRAAQRPEDQHHGRNATV